MLVDADVLEKHTTYLHLPWLKLQGREIESLDRTRRARDDRREPIRGLQWLHVPTKFHDNLPVFKSLGGGDTETDRHTDLISLLLFLESRLKIMEEVLFCIAVQL
jgi:hypothetical protein